MVFAVAGMAADVDLVFGAHSGPTHSLGAAVLVGAIAAVVSRRGRLSIAIAAAYATHTLLDWLGSDSSPPIGIMALWPFSRAYYESPLHVFMAISRRYWLAEFWRQNLAALARELVIVGPIAAAVWWGPGNRARQEGQAKGPGNGARQRGQAKGPGNRARQRGQATGPGNRDTTCPDP